MDRITYTGDYLAKIDNPVNLDVYSTPPELVEAVNLAMLLKQPLLLMGEPGCGKTRLAESVASELHQDKYKEHYFRWDIKSTSKAKEGIYRYDALKRMYDANAKNEEAINMKNYISLGSFAEALTTPQNGNIPNVLLIDEIDKADIDFPNDLLIEIEKGIFEIPELHQKVEKNSEVIILITSNRERELPPAFLRRCLYYYINFPNQQTLNQIVQAKFGDKTNGLIENAVNFFLDLRTKIESQSAESDKKPSTSELLEWFWVINHYEKQRAHVELPANILTQLDVVKKYKKGSIDTARIPFPQVLLKTWESNQRFNIQ